MQVLIHLHVLVGFARIQDQQEKATIETISAQHPAKMLLRFVVYYYGLMNKRIFTFPINSRVTTAN